MRQILRTNFNLQWLPFSMATVMLFVTLVVQPVNAVSIVDTIKCNTLTAFATTSSAALQVSQNALESTFELTLSVLQTTWKLEDEATAALRTVSEDAFTSLATAFANTPGLNAVQKQAVLSFQTLLLNSVHLLETNVDAAEAAYREDMLALVKSHENALGAIVQALITTINGATSAAVQNCSGVGVVATLTAVIAGANAQLLAQSIVLNAQSLAKGAVIVATRDAVFLAQDTQFAATATQATIKVTLSVLTGQPFTN